MGSFNKCDSAVMFGFIISLVLISDVFVVITSAQSCSELSMVKLYCEKSVNISYPFWYDFYLDVYNYQCGYPGFGIKCLNNATTVMNISNQLYRASNINYQRKFLNLKEVDIEGDECPHQRRNFSLQKFTALENPYPNATVWILFYNCSDPPNNKDVDEKYHVDCLDNSGRRSYAFPGEDLIPNGFNWYENCEKRLVTPLRNYDIVNYTTVARIGLDLYWSAPSDDCKDCENSGGLCSYYRNGDFHKCSCGSDIKEFDDGNDCENSGGLCSYYRNGDFRKCSCGYDFKEFDKTCLQKEGPSVGESSEKGLSTKVKVLIGIFTGVGVLLLLLLLIYKRILISRYKVFASHWRNNIFGSPTNVEMFLESCGHLTVQRYKYSDIKKMTNSFKEILGQGGYGSVFKGKLKHDGSLVAVKLLNESKGNGEDFINEVTTIGRTNHVNVVSLLGFCTEGSKRALVYEFMPNGSLEKFIYNEKRSTTPLGWEKLYQIAHGIAKGLEYLHRGCNTRILHFDIKPHNILLDQDFCPKISDFGLAKLCPTRESVVSMLVARGTIGYIAPEVYCRNFGGVSHKSDVYSYGMMVLEIVGGRKNIDATLENISEIYFPQWIYNHLEQAVNLQGSEEIFKDETTKKMILVALWCIQRQPADRPSISKVVEMLEGRMEEMQMPPNPFEDFPSSSS